MDVTTTELARRLEDEGLVLVDVRTRAEYTGELGAPCDPRRGRIPGARHLDIQELLSLDPGELRQAIGLPEGAEVIAYCHSGSRSATAVQLLRAAGYDARNYAGSWHEWSRDASLPAEVG